MNRQDELKHYGVKGMKWGVRRARSHDYSSRVVRGHSGPGIYLTRKRQLEGDKRDLERLNKGGHLSTGLTKKRQAAYDARDRKALEKRIAKNEKYYADKEAKKNATKKAVKEYSKQYDKAFSMDDAVSAEWKKANDLYIKTGKNRISRIINNIKGSSAEVKAYSKQYDKASSMEDKMDAEWKKAKDLYIKTGKNRISRIINNAKYS